MYSKSIQILFNYSNTYSKYFSAYLFKYLFRIQNKIIPYNIAIKTLFIVFNDFPICCHLVNNLIKVNRIEIFFFYSHRNKTYQVIFT